MRNFIIVTFFTFLIVSCKTAQKAISETDKTTIKTEINQVLNNWHLAATDANYDNYFGKMDSISVFIGTDASENWTKKQFANFSKPYFDKGKAWDFKTLERNVYVNEQGNFVWFDELLNTWMGTCRGSGVLEKKENTWVIKHYVLSVAIPNDDVQAVIAAKKKNDNLFLKKYN
ncbi:nuclear transport factor 2 family protein [Polaribacter vadi]|uniref:nuclear transport factor 2 family protein n=1 Tax=Polaribacter TaxID=52959 RepID=UPI001C0989CA|nr:MULTISPECIES: nuclear transport factor 2 family protein [Polaribacter]MBU3011403.1 nuclear transport factor 2 family protein [Polaribacter vadi]MDO6741215.1 nuclear transport factor 2 family protein [Polaribacter sp. 1_MG-2023]